MAAFFRYLRNGAFYNAVKRPINLRELHEPTLHWDVSQLPEGVALERPEVPGLWLIRNCVTREKAARMKAFFEALGASGRCTWHRYEPGREMMPLHANPALDTADADAALSGIDVFGEPGSQGADPVAGWQRLGDFVAEHWEGARELEELQRLPQVAIGDFATQRCLFLQAQILQSGAEVTPHRDALPFGGHMIATAVVEGSSEIRVGSIQFRVESGDMYAIAHAARYEVEHEVFSTPYDRFSITLRYGLECRPVLPALPGAAPVWEASPRTTDLFF